MRSFIRFTLLLILSVCVGLVARKLFVKPFPAPVPVAASPSSSLSSSVSSVPVSSSLVKRDELHPVGFAVRGRVVNIFMSDKTIRTELDAELTSVTRGYIVLDGKKLYIKPVERVSSSFDTKKPVELSVPPVSASSTTADLLKVPDVSS